MLLLWVCYLRAGLFDVSFPLYWEDVSWFSNFFFFSLFRSEQDARFFCHTCARQVERTAAGACTVCGNDFLEEVGPDLYQGPGAAAAGGGGGGGGGGAPQNAANNAPFQQMFAAMMGGQPGQQPRIIQVDPAAFQRLFAGFAPAPAPAPAPGQAQGQGAAPPNPQDQNPFTHLFQMFGAAIPVPGDDLEPDDPDDDDGDANEEAANQQQQPPPMQHHNHPLNPIQQMLNDMVRNLGAGQARVVHANNPQELFGGIFQIFGGGGFGNNNNAGDFVNDENLQAVLNRLFEQSGPQSRAADPETVANLKVEKIGPAEVAANEECPICQEVYVVNESVKCMPCLHRFHIDCLEPWLKMKNNCPVCRAEIKAEERREPFFAATNRAPPVPAAAAAAPPVVTTPPPVPETPEPPSPSDSDSEDHLSATAGRNAAESYDNMYL